MNWHKKILAKHKAKIISLAAGIVALISAFSLWRFALGKTFEWINIAPLHTPFSYAFYSTLVFVGPGAYLYYFTDFYKDLWYFFRHTLSSPGLHKNVKWAIWVSMVAAMFFVVKAVFDLINTIVSFLYNIFFLILYLSPSIGVAIIVFAVSYLLTKEDRFDSV